MEEHLSSSGEVTDSESEGDIIHEAERHGHPGPVNPGNGEESEEDREEAGSSEKTPINVNSKILSRGAPLQAFPIAKVKRMIKEGTVQYITGEATILVAKSAVSYLWCHCHKSISISC